MVIPLTSSYYFIKFNKKQRLTREKYLKLCNEYKIHIIKTYAVKKENNS